MSPHSSNKHTEHTGCKYCRHNNRFLLGVFCSNVCSVDGPSVQTALLEGKAYNQQTTLSALVDFRSAESSDICREKRKFSKRLQENAKAKIKRSGAFEEGFRWRSLAN